MRRAQWLSFLVFFILTACSGVEMFPSGSTPAGFGFSTRYNVELNTQQLSDIVTPTNFMYAATVSITNGEYSINGGAWSSSTGTLTPGQTVQVRHTSAATFSTMTTTVLKVGDYSTTFSSVTKAHVVPVANFTSDKASVITGQIVNLNGSSSTATSGGTLTYRWSLTPPSGSNSVLSSTTSAMTSFTPDVAGNYTVQLTVNDGISDSAAKSMTITVTPATVPVANPGPNQTVVVPGTVNLNGSLSSAPNGAPLTYAWSLTSKPAGSAAVLSSTNTVTTSFTADVAGTFTVQLIVSTATQTSSPATVTVIASANTPVAQIFYSPASNITTGTTVTLDGTNSTTPLGAIQSYAWTLSGPSGSTASLSSPAAPKPTFTPDVAGNYTVTLVVNNGTKDSAQATQIIAVTQAGTGAVAKISVNPSTTVKTGTFVTLDGSGSTASTGKQITTYTWELKIKPTFSNASVSSSGVTAGITPDIVGSYTVQLTITDSGGATNSTTVNITATGQ